MCKQKRRGKGAKGNEQRGKRGTGAGVRGAVVVVVVRVRWWWCKKPKKPARAQKKLTPPNKKKLSLLCAIVCVYHNITQTPNVSDN